MITGERVQNRDLAIGVVGLGYVGLPTAIGFHEVGFTVYGVDVSEDVISLLKQGKNPGDDPSFNNKIPCDERWNVSLNASDSIPFCDVVIVTVPTPVSNEHKPDLRFVKEAGISTFDHINKSIRPTVILESTVYPGVTREIWGPLLDERGLVEGVDLDLAYCPERFVPGDPNHGVRQVPRVVGAQDSEICSSLVALYSTLTNGGVFPVSSIEVAEASKVVENVQRDLNIALVNELALIFPEIGLDVEEVLAAAATKWNFHRYVPGIGVGGHCIPIDPYYLIQKATAAGAPVDLITSARKVNSNMPIQVASRILSHAKALGKDAEDLRILLLGWAYKPGISDSRESPTKHLAISLSNSGCEIIVWDPYIELNNRPEDIVQWVDDPLDANADIIVICTAHQEVFELDWTALREKSDLGLLFDGRRVIDEELLTNQGWIVAAIGRP